MSVSPGEGLTLVGEGTHHSDAGLVCAAVNGASLQHASGFAGR